MMAGRHVISNIPEEATQFIDTSGKSEINKWDLMAPGLNAYEWPATKKKIVQAIRGVRNLKVPNTNNLKERFNKEAYIDKIYEISKLERPK